MVWDYPPAEEMAESCFARRRGFVAMPYPRKSAQGCFGPVASQEIVGHQSRQESTPPTRNDIVTLGTCAAMREADQHSISLLEAEMDALFDQALSTKKPKYTRPN
jgi:hypothetical protein